MSLIKAVMTLEDLSRFIGSGELSDELESQFESAVAYVEKNIDSAVYLEKQTKEELNRARDLARMWVDSAKGKLERLRVTMEQAAKLSGGKLKSQNASISVEPRESVTIEITDFDRCATHYPTCVKVTTEDNKRVITIDKTELKKHVDFHFSYGFKVKTTTKDVLYVRGPRAGRTDLSRSAS